MSYIGNSPSSVAFLTDTFNGTGSQTAFTLSAAPAGTSSIIVAVSGVLQDPSTYAIVGTTLNFSAAPPSGTGNISVRFLGIPASGVTTTAYRTVTEFTATAGQTTFTPPSYAVGFISVFRNGVLLGAADYTATNGTTVVLAIGATSGDLVTVESFNVSSVLNAIPASPASVGTSYLVDGSVTAAKLASGAVTAAKLASGQTLSVNGITFPAAQVPSADANTLDDYEEGTWTPVIAGGSTAGSYTYAFREGRYTKIGRIVIAQCSILTITTSSAGSGILSITGLPFTASSDVAAYRSFNFVPRMRFFSTTRNNIIAIVGDNSSIIYIAYDNNGSSAGVDYPVTDISSGSSQIGCTVIYQVA